DHTPAVHPGVAEICNGIDDTCNGVTDEGLDQDGDGFTTCGGDCNDANPAVHPGAPEICDGLDDNCNGVIEDNLDQDGDGYPVCGDCNDTDPLVYFPPYEVYNLDLTGGSVADLSWEDQASISGPATV